MNILFFDTETTGVPINYKAPVSDVDNWPRIVQLAYIRCDETGRVFNENVFIIKPEGFIIPQDVIEIHGITNEIANSQGWSLQRVLQYFIDEHHYADIIVGHNISFDRKVMGAELIRAGYDDLLHGFPRICTMMKSTKYCQLPGNYGFKWPKLTELHEKLFGESFEGAHDALEDIRAAKKCYFELRRLGVISDQDIEKEFNREEIKGF